MYLLFAVVIAVVLQLLNVRKIKFGWIQITLGFCLWYAILQSGIEASIAGVVFAFTVPVNKLVAVEKYIHNAVNFLILPLFALANTAIIIPLQITAALNTPQGIGIISGLVLGKPIGIFLFSRLLVSLNLASLPTNVQWKQVLGMGALAGIGFTMSIFTTMLAFSDEAARDICKIAVLTSMLLSVIISSVYFWYIGLGVIETNNLNSFHHAEIKLKLT